MHYLPFILQLFMSIVRVPHLDPANTVQSRLESVCRQLDALLSLAAAELRPWHAAAQGVFQIIDTDRGAVDNLVEFKFASLLCGSLNVQGTVAPAAPRSAGSPVTRVDVSFIGFRPQIGWIAFAVPLGWANPKVRQTPSHGKIASVCCWDWQLGISIS